MHISTSGFTSRFTIEDCIANLINSIGEETFGGVLASTLYELCGADQTTAYLLESENLQCITVGWTPVGEPRCDRVARYVTQGWWKRDPAMRQAGEVCLHSAPVLIRCNLWSKDQSELRQTIYPEICDRLLLRGSVGAGIYVISVVRNDRHNGFDSGAERRVEHFGAVLIAALAKHVRSRAARLDASDAICDLSGIERCIRACGTLTSREAEVCARIICGLSALGISIELALSEETVKTYRKRAYHRLGIGSERELLSWYLRQWSRFIRGDAFVMRELIATSIVAQHDALPECVA